MLMTNSLATLGIMLRNACGKTMLNMVWEWVIPMASAPSNCPLSMEMIPPRTISAMYAPVFIDTMISPARVTFIVAPLFSSANPQKITIACTIMGVPLNTSMYMVIIQSKIFLSTAKTLFLGALSVRYVPISKPISKPTTVPTMATNTV